MLSFPAALHPGLDPTGERCAYGQHGPVFFLVGSFLPEPDVARTCTVPVGVHLYVPLVGAGCSTVEPPPFFGRDEAELRACVDQLVDQVGPQTLRVDGAAVPLEGYRVQSPLFSLALPPDNFLQVPPAVTESVTDTYAVLLAPLPVGTHTIVTEGAYPGGPPMTLTYTIVVAEPAVTPPTQASPVASPAA